MKTENMKKIIPLILCISLTLALPLSACSQKDKSALKPDVYTLQKSQQEKQDMPGDFTITIYDDGTFQYYETPINSYIGKGHYTIEDKVLALTEDEAGCTGDINYYQITDKKLLFIRSDSANYHFVPLEDGAPFVWTSDAP